MEFKAEGDIAKAQKAVTSINRIRLEFKARSSYETTKRVWVLIESDWNLKYIQEINFCKPTQVLIESDWNLKYVAWLHYIYQICINRIRLEFKVHKICPPFIGPIRINRIRLEFKDTIISNVFTLNKGINRIRLEFKVYKPTINTSYKGY